MAADDELRFTLGERTYQFPDPQTLTFAEIDQIEAAFAYDRTFEEIIALWIRGSVRATRLFAQIALERAGNHDEARDLENQSIGEFNLVAADSGREERPTKTRARKDDAPAASEPEQATSA